MGLAALPGLLTLFLSLNAGGFYPGAQGAAVVVLALIVALRMAFVRNPFAGLSRPLQVTVGALAAYSLWSLLSSRWSHSPARATLEFDLANVYLLTVLLIGSTARSHRRMRLTVLLTWGSMLIVCLVALATRLRPDLFPIPQNLSPDRLAYPLTYWNALGLFAGMGMTLALYFASSTREPRTIRVLATSTLPIFGVTILLTYSRSAIIIGAAGLIVYSLLARPRGLPAALIAGIPTCTFAIADTYQAKLISNASVSPAAVQQGQHLMVSILIACGAAALARVALVELDTRLANMAMSPTRRQNARILLAFACTVALVGTVIGFGGQISKQWSNFTKQDSTLGDNDVRNRIDDIRIGSRLPGWKIAIQAFDRNQFHGVGAGTFPVDYYQLRTTGGVAIEAHSIYLEAMSDLGIVGLTLIVVALATLIGACFVRARRSARSLWIAVGVIASVWALHAAVDWDWEMPAVTLPVFALAATALTRRGGGARLRRRYELALRLVVGVLALALLVTAGRISASDRDLNRSVAEFNEGNCPAAVADAHATISALSSRPQPYQIIGLCDVVSGHPAQAAAWVSQAVARDPGNWIYRYSLGVAHAAVGQDPQPALRQARALDPLETLIATTAQTFKGRSPRRLEQAAKRVEMLVTETDE